MEINIKVTFTKDTVLFLNGDKLIYSMKLFDIDTSSETFIKTLMQSEVQRLATEAERVTKSMGLKANG